jgi:hypothetical protein
MEGGDDVGQLHDARGEHDLVATKALRPALAVPPLKQLQQRLAHVVPEPDALGAGLRDAAVGVHRLCHPPHAASSERRGDPPPPKRRAARAEPAGKKRQQLNAGHVNVIGAGTKRDVVAEPDGELVRVAAAADPGQQGGVVDGGTLGLRQAQGLAQTNSDQRLAHDVFYRLAEPEVLNERQGAQQLSERTWVDPRSSFNAPTSLYARP